ncbi:MAG: hypothetical protein LH614_15655 [Pyrinomonadaceae bacterium]|nr:hypothetical protein [Pyrinomonadaceae bacterium]
MPTLLDELSQLISALDENKVEYAMCGGRALAIHGFARTEYGIDILIPAESLEKAYEIAAGKGCDIRENDLSFKEGAVQIRRVSKIRDDGEVLPLKFLLVTPQIRDVWETKEILIWQNRELWTVSRKGLIKMKTLAGRAKDLVDIERIKNEES